MFYSKVICWLSYSFVWSIKYGLSWNGQYSVNNVRVHEILARSKIQHYKYISSKFQVILRIKVIDKIANKGQRLPDIPLIQITTTQSVRSAENNENTWISETLCWICGDKQQLIHSVLSIKTYHEDYLFVIPCFEKLFKHFLFKFRPYPGKS